MGSMVGGLIAYGALGLFLGPALVAIAMAVGRIYRDINKGQPSRRTAAP